jgi:hypothetical protein
MVIYHTAFPSSFSLFHLSQLFLSSLCPYLSNAPDIMPSKENEKGGTIMQEIIREYLESAKFGRKQFYKNMAVFPLLSEYALALEYMLLDEALGAGLVEVTEVDNQGAVPNLKVHNRSPKMVLILDGEELVGAKQNRIVNTTILVAGNATVVIPVSCVEQGRWAYNTPRFHSEERMMPSRMRAMKSRQVQESVRAHGEYRADQSAIWADISERASRRDAASPSMAMAGIYEKDLPSLQEYLRHFSLIGSQLGAVFLINGKVVGMDAFGKPDTFSKTFKKLVQSYAMDAIDWFEEGKDYKPSRSDVTSFTKGILSGKIETHDAVGLGIDCRLESDKLTGFSLTLDGKVVHMSMFAREAAGRDGETRSSRMARYSRRRQNRVY